MKLNLKSCSLSLGVILAGLTLIFGLWYSGTGYASNVIQIFNDSVGNIISLKHDEMLNFFPNLGRNILALLFFTVLSFVDGLIIGSLFGLLYNSFLPKENK